MTGQRHGSSQMMLYALAGLLGAVGIGFLVAALISLQDDGSSVQRSGVLATATDTPVSGVEGAQSTQAPDPTPTTEAAPTQADSPTVEPAESATETETEVPAPTSPPAPTATSAPAPAAPPPPQPSPEPTEAQTEEPSPTPSGPLVAISGPATAAVGAQVQFSATVNPEPVTVIWRYLGQETLHSRSITITFPSDDCFSVELAAIYTDDTKTTVTQVAVGSGVCP